MKIAISGKGGVGKTTLTVLLAWIFAQDNSVTLVDADPTMNLPLALGLPSEQIAQITPLSQMKELIQERVGVAGSFFKLNPRVDDIGDKIAIPYDVIKLIVMGTIIKGGSGCACPDNILLRAFLSHLLLEQKEIVLVDMEAGIEHLGRRTLTAIDVLLVIVFPSKASIVVARKIISLAQDIGIKQPLILANKIATPSDKEFISSAFPSSQILGFIPFSEEVMRAEREGKSFFSLPPVSIKQELLQVKKKLTELIGSH